MLKTNIKIPTRNISQRVKLITNLHSDEVKLLESDVVMYEEYFVFLLWWIISLLSLKKMGLICEYLEMGGF